MYIKKITIKRFRSIKNLTWKIPAKQPLTGWHVILGDNGSGKTTLLRSMALALVGADQAEALRQNWDEWLTNGQSSGSISLDLEYDPDFDKFIFKSTKLPKNSFLPYRHRIQTQRELG